MLINNKAQVWVETAIYTLIGLAIIAIVLSAAMPQIDKTKDRGIVQQTISAMNLIDDKILDIEQSPANIRIIPLTLGKGRLEIMPQQNLMKFYLENTRLELSEVGVPVKEGNIELLTTEYGSRYTITLEINYTDRINITYEGDKDKNLVLHPGKTPYKIKIENVGDNGPNEKTHIDFGLV